MSGKLRFYVEYYRALLRGAALSLLQGIRLPFVWPETARSGAHTALFPYATYAPWQSDPGFRRVYDQIRHNTLVDQLRCYELWSLLEEVRDVPGAVVEVGVWRGGTGALLAARLAELGLEDPVYLCDTWEGVVKTGDNDPFYVDGRHGDTSLGTVQSLLTRLGLERVELLQGIFPEHTGHRVDDGPLRFLHVDVDVYQSAKDVVEWGWPRLSSGGVVVFDDYGFPACPGVTRLVDEQRGRPDRLVVHNVNGHAILIKR